MFIRETRKIDRVTKKEYCFYQLIESIRTERGPRQRILLNLGSELGIEKEQFKDLANRIEEIYCNQTSLIPYSDEIENLAKKFSKMLVRQQMQPATIGATSLWSHADYTSVDIESLSNEDCRTVGVEYILYKTLSKLGLPKKFTEIGFSLSQSNTAIASVIARAAFPASERSSHNWLQHHSALDELIGTDFKSLSLNKFYEVSDLLLENKKAIEDHLTTASKVLFNLQEKIILYDLTNTYFEGLCENNKKAKRGKSKQKRSDSPLVAMGLVLDAEGFPKRSDMFEGNVAETKTFQKMILSLHSTEYLFKPIIVMDAGIASEDNVNWLKDHKYPYVVVFRKKTQTMPLDGSRIIVKDKEGERVTAITKKNEETGEVFLYCHSEGRERREGRMKTKAQQQFEDALESIDKGLQKKGTVKQYDKVYERIGRLREKYSRVAPYYQVDVDWCKESNQTTKVTWTRNEEKSAKKLTGTYCLRTMENGLTEQQIWDVYMTLSHVEDAFRSMKSELGLRPVCHQLEHRVDGHLFITLLAYHIVNAIKYQLKQAGVNLSWESVRGRLGNHLRVTTTLKQQDGRLVRIRNTTKAEESHKEIYDALKLDHNPIKSIRSVI